MTESATGPLDRVRLWTGKYVRQAVLLTVDIRLEHILRVRPMAFLDLADFVHKPGFEMSEDTLLVLPDRWRDRAMISDEVMWAMEAMISGDSASDDLRLLNPLTGK